MVSKGAPSFGTLLKRYRRAAELSQEELARRAGYHPDYISMLERGLRSAPPTTVEALAGALQLGADDRNVLERAAGAADAGPSPSQFGRLLKQHRLAAGMTQEQLAERVNMSPRTISDLERGPSSIPRRDTVDLLSEALELSAADRIALRASAPRRLRIDPGGRPPGAALPADVTPLVGREREEAQAVHFLRSGGLRLLTLTGPGGVGKTRLGLRVAATLEREFSNGAAFVPLVPVRSHTLVISTIARALGMHETGDASGASLMRHLQQRELLLLLDNFEHVVDAAPVVAELLAACPNLKVLVTSRAALRLRGEQEMEVFPLHLPGRMDHPSPAELSRYPAVTLFVQRARAVKPDFELTPALGPVVAEICRRADGLPLAIELAAARVKVLSPEELLSRLEHRLQVLTGGTRDAPERQRSLRQTLDWSCDLLDGREQALFARLSVFVGGCTAEAAEAVCGDEGPGADGPDLLEGVASLVDNSLVRREESRYVMLETVREYAAERLAAMGQAGVFRRRHALYYVSLADRAETELFGADQAPWFRRLAAEAGNLRAAIEWAMSHDEVGAALSLVSSLWRFWQWYGAWGEWRRYLQTGLDQSADVPAAVRAKALWATGWMAFFQSDFPAARAFAEKSLSLARSLGDPTALRHALSVCGLALLYLEQPADALPLFEEALAIARALGQPPFLGASLFNLGRALRELGRMDEAIAIIEEALGLFRERGELYIAGDAARRLGGILLSRDEHKRAAELFREGLRLDWETGHLGRMIMDLEGVAAALAAGGRPEPAARLIGAADALREEIDPSLIEDQRDLRPYLETARAALDLKTWTRARDTGRTVSLEQAVAEALDERG